MFKPHEPNEAIVVGAQKKTASKEIMSKVPAEFYYSQWLFSGSAIFALGPEEHMTCIADKFLLAFMDL